MSCPPDLLEKLRLHRDALAQGRFHQEWIGNWWAGLLINDRRTLLAFADLDDSTENARRPWQQYSTAGREKLLHECKRLQSLLETIRWA